MPRKDRGLSILDVNGVNISDFYKNKDKEKWDIDKEFLRIWFKEHCDPYADKELPPAPEELVVELSRRYIQLYEMITGENFKFDSNTTIEEALKSIL